MLQITWHGYSCFQIKSRPATHDVNLVIDPYESSGSFRFPRSMEGDLVVSTSNKPEHANIKGVGGKPFTIEQAGEFEVKNVFVYGISAPKKDAGPKDRHTIYKVETENVSIAHLGSLNRELTDDEMDQLQNIDILMVPVGGGDVLTPKKAVEVINQIEPRIIIPMYYNLPNIKQKLTGVEAFTKELSIYKSEEGNKLKVSRKDLPEEDTIIYVLARV